MNNKKISVFIVEDSLVVSRILERMIESDPKMKIAGTALNGKEALEKIPACNPDVILTDLYMPVMDGLRLTEEIMASFPKPVLVISVAFQNDNEINVFRLLKAGAIDVLPKPKGGKGEEFNVIRDKLIQKIKIVAGVAVFKRQKKVNLETTPYVPLVSEVSSHEKAGFLNTQNRNHFHNWNREISLVKPQIVLIGISTGGPQTLEKILSKLPRSFKLPIVIVQHISEGFLDGMVEWMRKQTALQVEIAALGERPKPGIVYMAPERQHLGFMPNGEFTYPNEPPYKGHLPAVNVLFESAARTYKQKCLAILMTGIGMDGASGLKTLDSLGAFTVAQDEKSSIIFGMPKSAIEINAAKYIADTETIAQMLLSC